MATIKEWRWVNLFISKKSSVLSPHKEVDPVNDCFRKFLPLREVKDV